MALISKSISHFLNIDEEGFPQFSGIRVTDQEIGHEILSNIRFSETGTFTTETDHQAAIVEAFDEPYVAQMVHFKNYKWFAEMPYEFTAEFGLESLSLDEWDRFHGKVTNGIPFVFSRKAQSEFFQLVDDYDDDSITVGGKRYEIQPWLSSPVPVGQEKFWTDIYQNEKPGWELEKPSPILVEMLPKLKLAKSRILVLGSGSGNDAAHFAEYGHVVTAVDFSDEAIARAKQKYSQLKNINWVQADVFKLNHDWDAQFDVIFEHTLYCAIDPEKRNELTKVWRRLLIPSGFLMAIFFVMEKKGKPPFGGTEWEIRERLKKSFQFLYWTRARNSIERRLGRELFVYAVKK